MCPPTSAGFWRQLRAFAGPALLVSVGYMDPGNWGTDLQGGAEYRYGLLWVVALSSVMAIFMQVISARLGVVTGKDLAQACRDFYPSWTRWPNWIGCELRHRRLRFGRSAWQRRRHQFAVSHSAVLGRHHHRASTCCCCWPCKAWACDLSKPLFSCSSPPSAAVTSSKSLCCRKRSPTFWKWAAPCFRPSLQQSGMIVVAIGIIGATVMPHNLYLHSALVNSRKLQPDDKSIRRAIRFNSLDTLIALSIAFFVNAAILVMAAMVFYGKSGIQVPGGQYVAFNEKSDWIRDAYLTLAPLLGTSLASILFGVALLASGQSSTITGTLAGQVVMEGFMHWRIRPWVRRLITRLTAIVPAIVIIGLRGDSSVTDLLVLSQVVLALQLPFAMFPLLHFTSSKKWMGNHANGWFLIITGGTICLLITTLDIYGLPDALQNAWSVITGH